MSIYTWRRKYLKYGMVGLMAKRKSIPRAPLPQEHALSETEELEKLRTQLQELQFEVDVMKETIAVLKKDPGVDLTVLRNREKAVIIDALKGKYALPTLLSRFNMAKSSYYYQRAVMNKPDKYLSYRAQITAIFQENRGVYGYRRIYLALKREGVILSEKIIRRIMKEEELTVLLSKKRKYSSYLGEITPEVENIVSRDFHADQPYEKLLTDITEFAIPSGKLYLSAMIDCFDGKVAGWTTGTRPNADLVNTMLDQVIANLPEGCHPVVHSDRGCHYRWPGWIDRMNGAGLIRSMSKKGCSPDNAACEGFFGRLKNEMFYGRSWEKVSLDDFRQEIDRYINWYNHKRIKIPYCCGIFLTEGRRSYAGYLPADRRQKHAHRDLRTFGDVRRTDVYRLRQVAGGRLNPASCARQYACLCGRYDHRHRPRRHRSHRDPAGRRPCDTRYLRAVRRQHPQIAGARTQDRADGGRT